MMNTNMIKINNVIIICKNNMKIVALMPLLYGNSIRFLLKIKRFSCKS